MELRGVHVYLSYWFNRSLCKEVEPLPDLTIFTFEVVFIGQQIKHRGVVMSNFITKLVDMKHNPINLEMKQIPKSELHIKKEYTICNI